MLPILRKPSRRQLKNRPPLRGGLVDTQPGAGYHPGVLTYPAIDPVLVSIGPFAVRWYGLMYLLGFTAGFFVIRHRLLSRNVGYSPANVESLVLWAIFGLLLGARLGYVLFYHWTDYNIYLNDPLEIIAVWHGGMSFHGGLIGAVLCGLIYIRKKGLPALEAADAVFLAVPIGLACGRWGNFINAELFGRVTEVPWGMVFPGGGPLPRHPSQLYELLLEGPALLAFLWALRNRVHPGGLTALFLIGYSVARFGVEFVRQPDPQIGYLMGWMTMGQLLCLGQIAAGLVLWYWTRRRAG